MSGTKTEVYYMIRSEQADGEGRSYALRAGPYRLLSHVKMALRHKRWMKNPKIVKITRTFTEVEEVVDL